MSSSPSFLFYTACLPARLAIVYALYRWPHSEFLTQSLLLLSLGILLIFAFDLRPRGIEVGGDLIWWDHVRPLHAALWFAAAVVVPPDYRYVVMLGDTLFSAWLVHARSSS